MARTIPVSTDIDHALHRMAAHACGVLHDADVIAEHQTDREHGARGEYILRLVALEILLKAGAVRQEEELRDFGHDFRTMLDAQADSVQEWIRSEFGARQLGRHFETGRSLESQLDALTKNYLTARYVYEKSIRFTETERIERERRFRSDELPESEWDLIYYHGLIALLSEAMLGRLSRWIPTWFAEARSEG